MTALFIPIVFAIIGVLGTIYTYSSIKRGGARIYSLERETILRRATSALGVTLICFVAAVGLLVYQIQEITAVDEEAADVETTVTAEILNNDVPPQQNSTPAAAGDEFIPPLTTTTPEPTIDPNIPTPTPTIAVIRAFITETGGYGVNFRRTPDPNGELIEVLPEDSFVTLVQGEEPVEQAGFVWIKIRTFTGDEGWVVEDFLSIEGQ